MKTFGRTNLSTKSHPMDEIILFCTDYLILIRVQFRASRWQNILISFKFVLKTQFAWLPYSFQNIYNRYGTDTNFFSSLDSSRVGFEIVLVPEN
jgi:hypothetical protein